MTALPSADVSDPSAVQPWAWPIDQMRYDRRIGLFRCGDLQRSFWGWSEQDWIDLIDPSGENFRRTWPGQIGPNARPYVLAYAYLLAGFTAFDRIGRFRGRAWPGGSSAASR